MRDDCAQPPPDPILGRAAAAAGRGDGALLTGDVVRHTSSQRRGCVVEVGEIRQDGTTAYRVRLARHPDLGTDLVWWSSPHVRRVSCRDPYRRYLLLVTAEDDPERQGRRQASATERRHWQRRARRYGPWLPEYVWEKMYWRLCNLRWLDAGGEYVHYDLGRGHWRTAAIDCLERRDRAARWWMRPRPELSVPDTDRG